MAKTGALADKTRTPIFGVDAMRVRVRYLDVHAGSIVEDRRDVASIEEARQQLVAAGHTPVAIRPDWLAPLSVTRSRFDLRTFAIELRALLVAGLGVVGSLEALSAAQSNASHRAAIQLVLARVREGKSLSTALEGSEQHFPPLFRAAIRAGESSGRLPEGLERFASYLGTMERLRQSVIGAAIYPSIVMGFGTLVLLFLLGYVVPRFATAYEAMPKHGSTASSLLLSFGTVFSQHFQIFLIAIILAAWGLVHIFRSKHKRAAVLAWLMGIPIVSSAVRAFHLARLMRTTGMMIEGGHTIPEALRLGQRVLEGTPWEPALARARDAIETGRSFAMCMRDGGFTDEITTRLLTAGEQSGRLAEMLEHAAAHHERELAWRIESATKVVEPVLLILVAGVIGLVVLIMYMPIFELASTIG